MIFESESGMNLNVVKVFFLNVKKCCVLMNWVCCIFWMLLKYILCDEFIKVFMVIIGFFVGVGVFILVIIK